ncbi:MAG TPA: hypothetical protein VFI25_04515 [Planctomycetota bacterium]|jgi:hypothetical protein|nr:hypothetical protein [Planctomycetota bacterium]
MKTRSLLLLFGAGLSLAPLALAYAPTRAQATLLPPWGALDSDARGEVRLGVYDAEQRFWVRAEGLDASGPATPFEVWLEDGVGSGGYFPLGTMTLLSAGAGRWDLRVETDTSLASVADVAVLGGRFLQVRRAGGGAVVLEGAVPGIGAGTGTGGGGGNGPSERGQVSLQRPDPAPDADATGRAELEKRGGRQGFVVAARDLPTGAGTLSAELESGVGTGAFFSVGGLALDNAAQGRFTLGLEAEGAAPAILGVADLAGLAGRRVRVVDSLGTVFLWGALPGVAQSPGLGSFDRRSLLSPPVGSTVAPKAGGFVRSRLVAPQGASTFEVRANHLPSGPTFSVWIDDGTGAFVQVGNLAKGSLKRDTRKGQSLPLGVGTLDALAGRSIEIRDDASPVPNTILQGDVP